jgi:hypothetical protein
MDAGGAFWIVAWNLEDEVECHPSIRALAWAESAVPLAAGDMKAIIETTVTFKDVPKSSQLFRSAFQVAQLFPQSGE